MRARPLLVVAALVAVGLGTGAPSPAPAASECPVASTGRSIVRMPSGVDGVRALESAGASDVERIDASTAVGDLGGRDAPRGAVSVSPELERHLAAATSDTYRSLQWGLDDTHEEQAITKATGTGVTVAVLDSGVDGTHPDLAGQVLPGYDATVNPPTPVAAGANGDVEGHGTFVSGLIGALRDNGIGVAGVAPGVKILPIRVTDDTETILSSAVVRGVNLAIAHGAKVINMSFGGCGAVQAEQDAMDAARAAGVLVVASAGNLADGHTNNNGVPVYPAAYRNVLAVGAVTRGGGLAPYSVEGTVVDLSAPGGLGDGTVDHDIAGLDRSQACAQPPCYSLRAGTSFAAPHVSGVAALVLSANPALPPSEVERVLQSTAIDFGPLGRDPGYGEGRVDAAGALGLTMARRPSARLAGVDRYATAAALSANAYPSGAATVYLARGDVFSPDALAAGPAASHVGGPVLLTKPCELPSATESEIDRLKASTVVVLGGANAVCDDVLAAVAARPSAPVVRRVQGEDRYATAAALATDTFGTSGTVTTAYLARADQFAPDALVGGTAAGVAGAPIVLTQQCSLPGSTLGALDALHVTSVVVLGGPAAVCDLIVAQLTASGRTVQRVFGADRYATAVAVGRFTAPVGGGTVALARGDVFSPDALAAAPWAVAKHVPLLLSLPCNAPPASAIDVNDRDGTGLILVGGTAAICDAVVTRYQ
jgi:subtilisin family serine protease